MLLSAAPRQPAADEDREWQQILDEIAGGPPAFATVDAAVAYARKRPHESA